MESIIGVLMYSEMISISTLTLNHITTSAVVLGVFLFAVENNAAVLCTAVEKLWSFSHFETLSQNPNAASTRAHSTSQGAITNAIYSGLSKGERQLTLLLPPLLSINTVAQKTILT